MAYDTTNTDAADPVQADMKKLRDYGLSDTPLTDEQAAAFRLLFSTWETASRDDVHGDETEGVMIERCKAIVSLLWGESGLQMLDGSKREYTSPEDASYEVPEISDNDGKDGKATVASGGVMSMSLAVLTKPQLKKRLAAAFLRGQANRQQFVKMSLATDGRVRSFLSNAESLAAGTHHDHEAVKAAHDQRMVDWALGRGRHPGRK